jgi:hypothetical protein
MVAQTSTRLERSEVERLVREVLTQRLRGGATPPPARERHAAMPGKAPRRVDLSGSMGFGRGWAGR